MRGTLTVRARHAEDRIESGDGHSPHLGDPPVPFSYFVKSISLPSCSTRTSAIDTVTTLSPCGDARYPFVASNRSQTSLNCWLTYFRVADKEMIAKRLRRFLYFHKSPLFDCLQKRIYGFDDRFPSVV
jgi:hypothetical protein